METKLLEENHKLRSMVKFLIDRNNKYVSFIETFRGHVEKVEVKDEIFGGTNYFEIISMPDLAIAWNDMKSRILRDIDNVLSDRELEK